LLSEGLLLNNLVAQNSTRELVQAIKTQISRTIFTRDSPDLELVRLTVAFSELETIIRKKQFFKKFVISVLTYQSRENFYQAILFALFAKLLHLRENIFLSFLIKGLQGA
jgi:hypothetical protein